MADVKVIINNLIKNIDDIQQCIEHSNYDLMNKYIELFLANYTKSFMDIISYSSNSDVGIEKAYWTDVTNSILANIKSNDVFLIMDTLYFDLRDKLIQLVDGNVSDK